MSTKYIETPDGYVFDISYPDPVDIEGRRLSVKEGKQKLVQQAVSQLHKYLKSGDTVYTILRSVSRTGMSRCISLYAIQDNLPKDITSCVAYALDGHRNKSGFLNLTGCGMDMGFHTVHTLGRVMWPKGTEKPHGIRNGQPDRDGGYALQHRWL